MPPDRSDLVLADLGRIVTGKTPPTDDRNHYGGDLPFITPSDMNGSRHICSTARSLTERGAELVRGSRIPVGAVLVSCIGSDMGKAAITARAGVTNQQINSIIVDPPNEPLYVYYDLSRRKEELRQAAGGSAQPILNKSAFGRLPIVLPAPEEQRAIAKVLGSLDDKIEANRRLNDTLEDAARALFKSWFVDFDPVRAKAEGRQPFGMDAATAALFPDSFEDSELGEVPKGWSVGTLQDFAVLNPETWSRDTRPASVRYVDLANTKWGRIEATTTYAWDDAPSRAQRVLRHGDTIVGTVRPGNGSYALVASEGLTGSTGFAVLRPRALHAIEFVYLCATSTTNIETLEHLADGGAYPAVRGEVVLEQPVIRAPDTLVSMFADRAAPLLRRRAHCDVESSTLAELRDYLLPKLLAGEVRVRDAEKLVGDAV